MYNFSESIREIRRAVGLTQQALAQKTGVSLATLQNIETGRGNPSLRTLSSLLEALGIQMVFTPRPADWDLLAACGAPLTTQVHTAVRPTGEILLRSLSEAALELSSGDPGEDRERKEEALEALLLSLKIHFPKYFEQNCARSPLLMKLFPKQITGRLIKLKRLAAAGLATYL